MWHFKRKPCQIFCDKYVVLCKLLHNNMLYIQHHFNYAINIPLNRNPKICFLFSEAASETNKICIHICIHIKYNLREGFYKNSYFPSILIKFVAKNVSIRILYHFVLPFRDGWFGSRYENPGFIFGFDECSQGYWKEKKTFFCHITHIWCVGESKWELAI